MLIEAEIPKELCDKTVYMTSKLVDTAQTLRCAIEKISSFPNEAIKEAKKVEEIEHVIDEEYLKTKDASDTINSLWSENTHADDDKIVPLYNLLGHCYKATKEPSKARSIWEKSLIIRPQQQDIKDALSDLPKPLHKQVSLVID